MKMLHWSNFSARPNVAECCSTAFCGEYFFLNPSTFTSQHGVIEQPEAFFAPGSCLAVFKSGKFQRILTDASKTIGKSWSALRTRSSRKKTLVNSRNSVLTMLTQIKNAMKFSQDQNQPVANGTADTQVYNCGEPQTAAPPKDTFLSFDDPIFSLPPAHRQPESPETESFRQQLKAQLPQHKPSSALQQRIRELIKKG